MERKITEIELQLNNHCIKTGVRKAYEKLVKAYFKSASGDEMPDKIPDKILDERVGEELAELELKIEGMKFFLENADFRYLRSTYPELNGSDDAKVKVIISGYPCNIKINCNGKILRTE